MASTSKVFCSICNETFPNITSLMKHEKLHEKLKSCRKKRFGSYSSSSSLSTIMTMLCDSRNQEDPAGVSESTIHETTGVTNGTANNIGEIQGDFDEIEKLRWSKGGRKKKKQTSADEGTNETNLISNIQDHEHFTSLDKVSGSSSTSFDGIRVGKISERKKGSPFNGIRYLHLSNRNAGGIRITVGMNNDAVDVTTPQQQPVQMSSAPVKGSCEYCHQSGFIYAHSLESHLRRYHPDKTMPYYCSVCIKKNPEKIRFSKKDDFLAHMAAHTASGKLKRKYKATFSRFSKKGLDAASSTMETKKLKKKKRNGDNVEASSAVKKRDDGDRGGDLDKLSKSINLDNVQKRLEIIKNAGVPLKMEPDDALQVEVSRAVPTVTMNPEPRAGAQDESFGSVPAWTTVVKKEQPMNEESVICGTSNHEFREPKVEIL